MKITILNGSQDNWFDKFATILSNKLYELGHEVVYVTKKESILEGHVCFILSFPFIIPKEILERNKSNIVVHASDLPQGKGFSPLQWQILEGKNEITLTLFEVVEEVDAGPYYFKEKIKFDGSELYNELRDKLGHKIVEMCVNYIQNVNGITPIPQTGEESFYRRRTVNDDKINPYKSIAEQFNHFRIADNENHPLWFEFKGKKYILRIEKKQ